MSKTKKNTNTVEEIVLDSVKIYKTPEHIWKTCVEYDTILDELKQSILKSPCSFAGRSGKTNKTYSQIIRVPDKSVAGYKKLDSGLNYICSNIKRCILNRLEKESNKLVTELEVFELLYVDYEFNVTVNPDVSKVVRHYVGGDDKYAWIFQVTVNISADIFES